MANKKKEALALELRQIIQADRMAVDILRNAENTRKSVVAKTQQEKAAILAEAEQRRDEITKQVEEELAAQRRQALENRTKHFTEQRARLEQLVAQNRDGWIQEITRKILAAE